MDLRRMKTAATKGDPLAQFNLGVMYNRRLDDNGHPALSDRVEALKWLSQAARHGLPRAQQQVAELLCEGAIAAEWIEGCAWLLRARANTDGIYRHQAATGLAKIEAKLTADQCNEAARMAETFKSQESYVPQVWRRKRGKAQA